MDVPNLHGRVQSPTNAGHANVRTMDERETIPGRRFPKKIKTTPPPAGKCRICVTNIFAASRTKLIPNEPRYRCASVHRRVGPRDKERRRLSSIAHFQAGVKKRAA